MTFQIGKRYLIYKRYSNRDYVTEVIVLEISPSMNMIKFKYVNGVESWNPAEDYVISEELEMKSLEKGGGRQ